ncbi:MAG: HNH endonuclease [Acidimicrobiia bacterium]|nr:HNH endonuclease [Acidimicrobiia bacterium]
MFGQIDDLRPSADSGAPDGDPSNRPGPRGERHRPPTVADALRTLRHTVELLDTERIDVTTATALAEQYSAIERLAAAATSRCAQRAAKGEEWKRAGHRSPAHWMAAVTGSTPTATARHLSAIAQLDRNPRAAAAYTNGQLSRSQAALLAPALAEAPHQADELLDAALEDSVAELRDKCRDARARARGPAEGQRHAEQRQRRRLTRRTTADGLEELALAGTADDIAFFNAGVSALRDAAYADHKRLHPDTEPSAAAIGFDAAMLLARHGLHDVARRAAAARSARADAPAADNAQGATDPPLPSNDPRPSGSDRGSGKRFRVAAPELTVRVDHTALARGHALPGEICDVPGGGPLAVCVVEGLIEAGCRIAVVEVDDLGAVRRVAHRKRRSPSTSSRGGPTLDPTAKVHPTTGADTVDRSPPWWLDVTVIVGVRSTTTGAGAGVESDPAPPTESAPATVDRQQQVSALLARLDAEGTAVGGLVRHRRAPSAHQRTALRWRDPTCRVEGCTSSARLEMDHHVDWAHAHRTTLDELGHLCPHHHRLRTFHGYRLGSGPGKQPLLPPVRSQSPHTPRPDGPTGDQPPG